MQTLSINVATANTTYATYMHSVTAVGADKPNVIYVGYCKLTDVISAPDARRNTKWREITATLPNITLSVAACFGSADEAERYAKQLADHFKAICNAVGQTTQRGGRVRCIDDDTVYANANAACKHFDIASSAMSNHLNGHRSHRTVKGLRFERIA